MSKTRSSESTQTAKTTTSTHGRKTIKNTFAPGCDNEYFTDATLFSLCRYGFSFDDLPKEGKKMVDAYVEEYLKRCTKPGDPPRDIPDPPDNITIIT